MALAQELAALFERDLTRLLQQFRAFTDEDPIWQCPNGMTNSPGNLALHLEGNLREYIGRLLGRIPYVRMRDQEFGTKGIHRTEIVRRLEEVRLLVPEIVAGLSDEHLDARFPEDVLGVPLPIRQFLIHLNGHLNYHLGQIDSMRRILTSGTAVEYARL